MAQAEISSLHGHSRSGCFRFAYAGPSIALSFALLELNGLRVYCARVHKNKIQHSQTISTLPELSNAHRRLLYWPRYRCIPTTSLPSPWWRRWLFMLFFLTLLTLSWSSGACTQSLTISSKMNSLAVGSLNSQCFTSFPCLTPPGLESSSPRAGEPWPSLLQAFRASGMNDSYLANVSSQR